MKKFIIIVLSVLVTAVCFSSCNSIKKDIEASTGYNIKNLKVEKVKIQDTFYEFSQEYNEANDVHLALLRESDKFQDKYDHANSMFDLYINWDLNKAEQYVNEMEVYAHYVDSLYQSAIDYLEVVEEAQQNHLNGTVYVVKYVEKDEYGHWNNFNTYGVFTYNDNKVLYPYDGDNSFGLIMSCYPEAEKEFKEKLGLFGALFTSELTKAFSTE